MFGLEVADSPEIEFGFLLHDIGKVAIPDSILHKPEPLTPQERDLIQQHPVIGWEIVRQVDFLDRRVLPLWDDLPPSLALRVVQVDGENPPVRRFVRRVHQQRVAGRDLDEQVLGATFHCQDGGPLEPLAEASRERRPQVGPPQLHIDAMKAEDLLTKLSNLRIASFESRQEPALRSPTLAVAATFGQNKELVSHGYDPEATS